MPSAARGTLEPLNSRESSWADSHRGTRLLTGRTCTAPCDVPLRCRDGGSTDSSASTVMLRGTWQEAGFGKPTIAAVALGREGFGVFCCSTSRILGSILISEAIIATQARTQIKCVPPCHANAVIDLGGRLLTWRAVCKALKMPSSISLGMAGHQVRLPTPSAWLDPVGSIDTAMLLCRWSGALLTARMAPSDSRQENLGQVSWSAQRDGTVKCFEMDDEIDGHVVPLRRQSV